jgi:ABC-2 type transport system ATP-binding protein
MADRDPAAIEARGLAKRYGATEAVAGIDLFVARGATAALLGGNGAGKTTTLAMLLGLVVPSAGSIRVLGEDMLKHRYRVLHRMNFSSPYTDLPHRLTVRQNLIVYGRLYGVRDLAFRIDRLAADLQLAHVLDRETGKLSSGLRTRVALAKSLINDPELLLLDEPTASLDPDTADWVRTYLEQYRARRGATILFASHNMGEVERLASDVMMMRQGRIVDRGTAAELVSRHGRRSLEDVFLEIARERRNEAAQ